MDLLEAWRRSRLTKLGDGEGFVLALEEYEMEWWLSARHLIVECRLTNEMSVVNEMWTSFATVRSRRRGSCTEDKIECHCSSSRNGMRAIRRVVVTDSSKITMVHLAKDGEYEDMGHAIRMALGPQPENLMTSLRIRSSWEARMRGSERAADTVAERPIKRRASKNETMKGDNAISDHMLAAAHGKWNNLG